MSAVTPFLAWWLGFMAGQAPAEPMPPVDWSDPMPPVDWSDPMTWLQCALGVVLVPMVVRLFVRTVLR